MSVRASKSTEAMVAVLVEDLGIISAYLPDSTLGNQPYLEELQCIKNLKKQMSLHGAKHWVMGMDA